MSDHPVRGREQWLADTLVELADTLVADFDLLELLGALVGHCTDLLDASQVGLVLKAPTGRLTVMASSTERMHALELFEVQAEQGPCLDCIATGTGVSVADLDAEGRRRWPAFSQRAIDAGFHAALALPMRLREQTIGAVNVLFDGPPMPSDADVRLAQALADVSTISILQTEAKGRSDQLAEQLQVALDSRIVLEQAKGMVAELLQVDVDEAFRLLRDHARRNRVKLASLARDVVERRFDPSVTREG